MKSKSQHLQELQLCSTVFYTTYSLMCFIKPDPLSKNKNTYPKDNRNIDYKLNKHQK